MLPSSAANIFHNLFGRRFCKGCLRSLYLSFLEQMRQKILPDAGHSSLGKLRYAALLSVSAGGKDPEYCLMYVKEAIPSAAITSPKSKMPADNAERVVEGARHLSPALGDRMRAAQIGNKSVFIRELLPQDLKIEIETLSQAETMRAGYFFASVVGKAHARQMDSGTANNWLCEVSKNRSKSLDAPSWLWTSVVELLVD